MTTFKNASAAFLHRKLSVGYARAARILDEMQSAGIVGPADGSKPRDILIRSDEEFLNKPQEEPAPQSWKAPAKYWQKQDSPRN